MPMATMAPARMLRKYECAAEASKYGPLRTALKNATQLPPANAVRMQSTLCTAADDCTSGRMACMPAAEF